MSLDEGAEIEGAEGVLATGVPLGTISHGPAAFVSAPWLALHPASHSTSAASKAAVRKGAFKTRSVLNRIASRAR